jgi:hypothetical protein
MFYGVWSLRRIPRPVLAIVLVYFLWLRLPNIIAYATVVRDSSRQLERTKVAGPSMRSADIAKAVQDVKEEAARKQASIGKVTARTLESQFVQKRVVSQGARIHCDPVAAHWDYVCTYLPTPKTSSTRVQFGVQVDRTSWVQTSPIVPEGTDIPAPSK